MKIKSMLVLMAFGLSACSSGRYAGVPAKYNKLIDQTMAAAGANAKELKKALKEAQRIGQARCAATTEASNFTRLPFADGAFDSVVSCLMLHHVIEWEAAVAEIARVLKPGGQLFAPTFVHGKVPRTRLRMLAMRCAGLQIYNSWMVPQYLAFLQAGGFAVQEHALLGDTLAPLCYARAVPDKTRVTQR